jgi:hypothetical protein
VQTPSKDMTVRGVFLGTAAFIYFVIFPQDLDSVMSPVENVLAVSAVVSPWLYGVIGLAIGAWVVIRVWGRTEVQWVREEGKTH